MTTPAGHGPTQSSRRPIVVGVIVAVTALIAAVAVVGIIASTRPLDQTSVKDVADSGISAEIGVPIRLGDVVIVPTGEGTLPGEVIERIITGAIVANDLAGTADERQWRAVLASLIQRSSGGFADAVDITHPHGASIAADGNPSAAPRGLMALLPRVFAAHHVSGTSANIFDPMANVSAALHFMLSRYGSPGAVPIDR